MFFSYGGVILQDVKTLDYKREAVRDHSGTDLQWVKFSLTVQGIFNPGATSYLPQPPGAQPQQFIGEAPVITDRALREYLLIERQQLVYEDENSNVSINSPAQGFVVDAAGGPFPQSVNVDRIDGIATWFVVMTIVTYLSDCIPANPIVTNRWSMTDETDKQWITTRITRGEATFRLDVLAAQAQGFQVADAWRKFCIPGLPQGFQRERLDVTVTPRGDRLVWTTVDKRQKYSLGGTLNPQRGGVVDFEAVYTQATIGASASLGPAGDVPIPTGMQRGMISIHVVGQSGARRANLITWALRLANERLGLTRLPNRGGQPIVTGAKIDEQVHDWVVDLRMEVLIQPPAVGLARNTLNYNYIGIDTTALTSLVNDGNNPQLPLDDNARGPGVGLLIASALRVYCTTPPQVPSTKDVPYPQGNDNTLGSPADFDIKVGDPDPPQSYGNSYSALQTGSQNGSFTYYDVRFRYEQNQQTLQAPIASGPVSYSSNGQPIYDTNSEIITLAAPTSRAIVEWMGESVGPGQMPLPQPILNDPNWVLLRAYPVTCAPWVNPGDGLQPIWRMSGRYEYAQKKAIRPGDALPSGAVPWGAFDFNSTFYGNYQPGIISPLTTGLAVSGTSAAFVPMT